MTNKDQIIADLQIELHNVQEDRDRLQAANIALKKHFAKSLEINRHLAGAIKAIYDRDTD